MNDHPLGLDPGEAPPIGSTGPAGPVSVPHLSGLDGSVANGNARARTSIVDSMLNLDEFLAADVRLAEKQAAFYTRPEIEARIQEITDELDSMTDSQGQAIGEVDGSLEASRTPEVVALEIRDLQQEYAASRRTVLMRQMDQDDWAEFQGTWKDALAKNPPYPPEFYVALIVKCAVRPAITPDQVVQLRKKLGAPAFEELWGAAWTVNTRSGVNIPKSLLSSAVLRQNQPG